MALMPSADPNKELVLPPGRQMFIQYDKGVVDVWVGPIRVTSSSSNELPIIWDHQKKIFIVTADGDPRIAIRSLIQVARDEYVILEGLPILKQGDAEHPPVGQTRAVDIDVAERTTLHGPQVFALWPRQNATVVPGHRLAFDQYLLVRVYDDRQAAREPDPALPKAIPFGMGDLFIIKGTDTRFYMPGPGIEVVRDEEGNYVRNAVTLEQLEYAYLRDQSGKKEYVYGPAVVYPQPTQTFVTRTLEGGAKVYKFRVLELTETSGLLIKVTAPYIETDGTQRAAGDELFLTGKNFPLYWPRVEHMLITQGGAQIHQSIAIPDKGSGYYIRNKRTWTEEDGTIHDDGVVELIRGPKTLLIDPRNQTLTKRALPLHYVSLTYPGNPEAMAINEQRLRENAASGGRPAPALEAAYMAVGDVGSYNATRGTSPVRARSGRDFEGERADRPNTYQKPHAIDLGSSKYDGAPRIAVRPGYAVLLTNSVGRRRVVKDGEVGLLEYDEFPTILRFSTGTPKSGATRREDVYLRTVTKVSDRVNLETKEGVLLTVELSFRVRFEDDPTKWFDVEDPIGFMTDNLRSIIHHAVSKIGIREFHANFAGIIRTIVLGESEDGKRPGRTFTENGLHIYDVDVLGLRFNDPTLEMLFADAAKTAFKGELQITREQHDLELSQKLSAITLAQAELHANAAEQITIFTKKRTEATTEAAIAEILAATRTKDEHAKSRLLMVMAETDLETAEVNNAKIRSDYAHAMTVATHDEELRLLNASTQAAIQRLEAIQPRLIETLTFLGETELLDKLGKHFNVQAILGGTSVTDALAKVFSGTRFANLLEQANTGKPNGNGTSASARG